MPARLCPLFTPHREPSRLAYSFTVPGEPRSAAVARGSVRTALRAHELADIEEPAVQVVSELVACAALFAPDQNLYVSLGWHAETLRIVSWDPHPPGHRDRALGAVCTARRRRQLLLAIGVVRECRGTWGAAKPAPATEGTTVWANLPRTGAAAYAARRC
ncbi:ATP-binding protein [Streptomyces morookaense]|uniref:ATP-binding protein n=1 Tax=Streptomyces morookaense TaxID=1970 RepID=UPI0033D24A83